MEVGELSTTTSLEQKLLKKNEASLLSVRALMGAYVWLKEPIKTNCMLTFQAKGTNDIHVCLTLDTTKGTGRDGMDFSPHYELVIGGWLNSKTAFRRKGIQKAWIRAVDNKEAVITSRQFEKYWLYVGQRDHSIVLVFGKGSAGHLPLLQYCDDDPLPFVHVGFSTWDTPIQFRSIDIAERAALPAITTHKVSFGLFVNSPRLSDVTFVLDSKDKVYGHKSLIGPLSTELMEKMQKQDSIRLKGVHKSSLLMLLEWMYTGCIQSLKERASEEDEKCMSSLAGSWGLAPSFLRYLEQSDHSSAHFEGRNKREGFSLLLKSGLFSDVVFVIHQTAVKKKESVKAHRVVLAGSSDPFKAMFTSGFQESVCQEVDIYGATVDTFNQVLRYIYTGQANLMDHSADEVVQLLLLADRYDLEELKNKCCEFLELQLSVADCCSILALSSMVHSVQLRNCAISFIQSHFRKVADTEGLLDLDEYMLMELLIDDNLVVSEEQTVFEAVMRWADHQASRKQSLTRLLYYVRFHLMEKTYLKNQVLSNEAIQASPKLLRIVEDAIAHTSDSKAEKHMGPTSLHIVDNTVLVTHKQSPFRMRKRAGSLLKGRKELLFSHGGDSNGLFQYLGSGFGVNSHWRNPHTLGIIHISESCPVSRWNKPEQLCTRKFRSNVQITGAPPSFTVSLGKHSLICNYYAMRQGGADVFITHWKLQGSNDKENWTSLRKHSGDESLMISGEWAAWPVAGNVAFNHFRVVCSKKKKMAICCFELYGYFK